MDAVEILVPDVGTDPACKALGVSRAGLYRRRTIINAEFCAPKKRPAPPRTLSAEERQTVLDITPATKYVNQAA